MSLPCGVRLLDLSAHRDLRGDLTEVFRAEWDHGVEPVQWNVARSAAGALRGVHVHPMHDDFVVLLSGRMWMGFYDSRRGSPTFGSSGLVALSGERLQAVVIPRGVAHGSVHRERTHLLVGVSVYHGDPLDELGCRWDDPALGIEWPEQPSLLSERDLNVPLLAGLLEQLEPWQPFVAAETSISRR